MIMLHKNDKIIILAAVIIIILAGAGIAVYTAPETDLDDVDTGETKTFLISWDSTTSSYATESYTAAKNDPFTETMTISEDNLISVTFEITWTDDSTYGLLRTKGEDTLTADITYEGQTKSEESTGNGTFSMTFMINSLPTIKSIEATDANAALQQIQEEYYKTDHPSFDLEVAIQTGERIIRPLKYIRDKGNDFDLKITYEYFMLTNAEEQDDDIKDTGGNNGNLDDFRDNEAPPALGMIINTGCGRYI